MKIRSLGYRTDLFFPAFDGRIIDRGDYLVVRTPSNPTFFWGNFLIFSQPPREGDFEAWRALFAREIGTPPDTKHQVFGWDSPEGEQGVLQPFLAAGFLPVSDVVLVSHAPGMADKSPMSVSIRPLETEADWEQALENQMACRNQGHGEAEYREFRRIQKVRYQKMSAEGHGDWYGAFMGDRLVADMGLYHHEGVGRYQSVETHPDFRRQGIAGRMIAEGGRRAMEKYSLHSLVIVAEQDSSGERLYTSLGFNFEEKQLGLQWWTDLEKAEGDKS